MKVVHIVPAPFGGPDGITGGAERYALELARHMAKVVPTSLVAFGDEDRTEHAGPLRVRTIGRPWYVRGQRSNPLAFDIVREVLRADIVHCHQQHVAASSVAALVSRATRRLVFSTDLGGGGFDISGYVSTDRWFHGHLHISEYSRTVFGHASLPRARVVGGGVDTDRFVPAPGVARDGPILFVGRLLPHKGVNDLVEACEPGMQLELIGREGDARFLDDLRRLSAGKDVGFRRECSDQDLVAAYQRARCVVQPSVYRDLYGRETRVPELLGLVLLEAMACGAPCVCTAVASLPEVVEDGVTGFVVPPNSPAALGAAIRRLLNDPDLAARMGAAGRRRVLERFGWDGVVARCLAAYRGSGRTPA